MTSQNISNQKKDFDNMWKYSFNKNRWRIVWDIPLDAELGLYDVKVVVKEIDGGKSVKIEKGEFMI